VIVRFIHPEFTRSKNFVIVRFIHPEFTKENDGDMFGALSTGKCAEQLKTASKVPITRSRSASIEKEIGFNIVGEYSSQRSNRQRNSNASRKLVERSFSASQIISHFENSSTTVKPQSKKSAKRSRNRRNRKQHSSGGAGGGVSNQSASDSSLSSPPCKVAAAGTVACSEQSDEIFSSTSSQIPGSVSPVVSSGLGSVGGPAGGSSSTILKSGSVENSQSSGNKSSQGSLKSTYILGETLARFEQECDSGGEVSGGVEGILCGSEFNGDMATNDDIMRKLETMSGETAANFEKLNQTVGALTVKVGKIEEELKEEKKSNVALKKELKSVSCQLAALDQYGRRESVEVTNIPYKNNRSAGNVFDTIMHHLPGVEFTSRDISAMHFVPARNNRQNLLIKFINRQDADRFIKALKDYRPTIGKLGLQGDQQQSQQQQQQESDTAIYVGVQLSRHFKEIMGAARQAKRENKIHACWYRNETVMIKKRENDIPIRVQCKEDLLGLI
jgi:hypothetical protein